MSLISLLPDVVISQIAAGEVLENPASAVKELIENAIDAKASEILVVIDQGGFEKISIEDDGCGMHREDAILCLQRHATSKLKTISDLDTLKSMGFRGEALAAIASVSKIEIRTSTGREGTRLLAEAGQETKVEPCARNQGTTIYVSSLFYNTPARLKFQKSPATSAAAILKIVQTLSLAYPEISFSLVSNGKKIFQAEQKDHKKRLEEVLGPFAHEIQEKNSSFAVRGFLASPEEAKVHRKGQILFVNRRMVFSPLIAKAVKEGFSTRLEERLFPGFVLFLDVPSDVVDVNVHPQKKEVRFQEEAKIFSFIQQAVGKAFESASLPLEPLPWSFTPPPLSFLFQETPAPAPKQEQQNFVFQAVKGKPVALLQDYLLVDRGEWLLVDLKGAKARILFEEMGKKDPELQPLVCPFQWTVGPAESVEELALLLQEAHVECSVMGKNVLSIEALPQDLELSLLPSFIEGFSKKGRFLASLLTRLCRASKEAINFDKACLLWQRLNECTDQLYDPLGKKIVVPIKQEDLAEHFR